MNTSSHSVYLEHANITTTNIEESIRFFQAAFPSFKVRGGQLTGVDRWVHVGTDETYVAFNEKGSEGPHPAYRTTGFNHLGFVVEDVESIANRLSAEGYTRSYPKQVQPTRIRDYFLDADGNEYEFVQYLSEATEDRNRYDD